MKILAVDYGDARTGLAMCDRTEFLASPIGIIEEKSMPKVAEKIGEIKGLSTEEVAAITMENGKRFFRIPE